MKIQLKNIFNQLLVVSITASFIVLCGLGIVWIFTSHVLDDINHQSPFTNPILWGAILLMAIASLGSFLWRKYTERKFIKSLTAKRKKNRQL